MKKKAQKVITPSDYTFFHIAKAHCTEKEISYPPALIDAKFVGNQRDKK